MADILSQEEIDALLAVTEEEEEEALLSPKIFLLNLKNNLEDLYNYIGTYNFKKEPDEEKEKYIRKILYGNISEIEKYVNSDDFSNPINKENLIKQIKDNFKYLTGIEINETQIENVDSIKENFKVITSNKILYFDKEFVNRLGNRMFADDIDNVSDISDLKDILAEFMENVMSDPYKKYDEIVVDIFHYPELIMNSKKVSKFYKFSEVGLDEPFGTFFIEKFKEY